MVFYLFFKNILSVEVKAHCIIENNKIIISQDKKSDSIVTGYWADSLNETGWYKLRIKSNNNSHNSTEIMRCAGALEGYLSYERIHNHYMLIKDMNGWQRDSEIPIEIKDFMRNNLRFVDVSIEAYQDSSYWKKVSLIYEQFLGLVEGYNMKNALNKYSRNMSILDHWILQSEGDLMDVTEKLSNLNNIRAQKTLPGDHCTGMIRLLPDFSDLYFAHDAWSDYRELHGELKEYDLNISEFNSNRITMSTRVGKISSYDDLYVNDKGLMIFETTLSHFNESLYDLIKPNALFTWIRAVIATWCATSGNEWTEYFTKFNSGTYNNEYLIVDMNKFKFNEKPIKDLLWIIEQLPGKFRSADITDVLVNLTFFPSFNTPYFTDLFEYAMYPEKIKSWSQDGNYWDYQNASRRLIAMRELPYIFNFEDFKKFMRYNNYARDPISNGDPGQNILSRYDLRDGKNPHFPIHMFGGLDSKVIKLSEAKYRMTIHALASPAFSDNPINKLPPFKFSDWPEYKHDGLYEGEWKFNWTIFESSTPDMCSILKTRKQCIELSDCGWCSGSMECYPGNTEGPYFNITCKGDWSKRIDRFNNLKIIGVVVLILCIAFTGATIANKINHKRYSYKSII